MSELYHYDANQLGKVEIAPEVIQLISGIAASRVEGVISLSGGVVGDINQLLGRKNLKKGIRVDLEEQLTIDLAVVVQYGYHIPDVGREIQEQVKSAVESMTGLAVDKVIVRVDGIKMPQEKTE
ncbi:Asp23/Gls24 family envelope stress response protein [Laceyella putida]|uniref:Asp23/Gls24 family envelope stress response protein n=1 Tax=Laceyella putida TaxID=110101 RepID=A0ABW2RIW7_9BACL